MKKKYTKLKKKIMEKSLVLVEVGDMSSVHVAMQALNEIVKLERTNISDPLVEVNRLRETHWFTKTISNS